MKNKYIENLTVNEYKSLSVQLGKRLDDLKEQIKPNEKSSLNNEYVEVRFMKMKIDQIIKKYEKT